MRDKIHNNKGAIVLGALAGALAYSLFGPVGLICVGVYLLWKWI